MKVINYNSDMERHVVESTARILHLSKAKTDDNFASGRLGLEQYVRRCLRTDSGIKEISTMIKNIITNDLVKTRTLSGIISRSHVKNTLRLIMSTSQNTKDVMQLQDDDSPEEILPKNYFETPEGERTLQRINETRNRNTCISYHDLELYGLEELNKQLNAIPGYEKVVLESRPIFQMEDFIEKRYWCGKLTWVYFPMLPSAILEENR